MALARPCIGCCSFLGNESVDENLSLSVSLSPFLTRSFCLSNKPYNNNNNNNPGSFHPHFLITYILGGIQLVDLEFTSRSLLFTLTLAFAAGGEW